MPRAGMWPPHPQPQALKSAPSLHPAAERCPVLPHPHPLPLGWPSARSSARTAPGTQCRRGTPAKGQGPPDSTNCRSPHKDRSAQGERGAGLCAGRGSVRNEHRRDRVKLKRPVQLLPAGLSSGKAPGGPAAPRGTGTPHPGSPQPLPTGCRAPPPSKCQVRCQDPQEPYPPQPRPLTSHPHI